MAREKIAVLAALGAGLGYLALRSINRVQYELRNKVVLITGGSRGLGLQIAREFGARGAIIVICARDENELDAARTDLASRGAIVHALPCDITHRDQVAAMVRNLEKMLGGRGVDVLVNNAGVIKVGPLAAMTLEDFEQAMDVMFWGMLHTTLAVLPSMRARREGRIVNIASIGGKVSVPHLLPYACAKFAAVALSRGLRTELSPLGIHVTTIIPGLMRTGSHLNAEFKGDHAKEYGWFAAGAATPVISISAQRAARSVVDATIRGEAERVLSLPAAVADRVQGVAPNMMASVLEFANQLMPSRDVTGPTATKPGHELESDFGSAWKMLTRSGQHAAEALNEV